MFSAVHKLRRAPPAAGRPGIAVCVAASSCVVELGRRLSVRWPELSCLPSPSDSRGFCK